MVDLIAVPDGDFRTQIGRTLFASNAAATEPGLAPAAAPGTLGAAPVLVASADGSIGAVEPVPVAKPVTREIPVISAPATGSLEQAAAILLPLPKPGSPVIKVKPLIVIDPGHGGIDPGAVSPSGSAEKDVVRGFSEVLKQALEATGRYDVHLTRSDDVFLSLRDRVQFARRHKADLFIAIHADALRRGTARGATVYTLADKASDAEAEALAHKENRSDIIAGVDLMAETEQITGILIDLAQREAKNHATTFAKQLVTELKPVANLNRRPIRSAGFRVLKAPDVPSVLFELGYLSNRSDETLLKSPEWRGKVAGAMAGAIGRYFATQIASGE
jgi:N-acetylmuramoyl-L-alanine amidase